MNFPSKPAKRNQTSSTAPSAKANKALREMPRKLDHILDVPVRLHAEHIEHMVAALSRKKAPSKRGLQPLIRFEDNALRDADSV